MTIANRSYIYHVTKGVIWNIPKAVVKGLYVINIEGGFILWMLPVAAAFTAMWYIVIHSIPLSIVTSIVTLEVSLAIWDLMNATTWAGSEIADTFSDESERWLGQLDDIRVQKRLRRAVKKNEMAQSMIEWVSFLDQIQHRGIPEEWERYRYTLREQIKNQPAHLKISSAVFNDPSFRDAVAKAIVLFEDDALRQTFLTHRNQRGTSPVAHETMMKPIRDTMRSYEHQKRQYKNLEEKTNINTVNTILSQDFTQLRDVK